MSEVGETPLETVTWLPAALRPPAEAVLVSGHRMAQEAVGYKALRALLQEGPDLLLAR
jgi:hypothetical protein